MADTHGPQEPHQPEPDTSDHGHHDVISDEPITRPDGTLPPSNQRPLSLGVGIAGAIIVLLIIAAVILYMNRNGNTAEAPAGTPAAGGAAPEAIISGADQKGALVPKTVQSAALNIVIPGAKGQDIHLKNAGLARPSESKLNVKAASTVSPTRTPTPGAGSRATAAPTKTTKSTTWNDSAGRFVLKVPAGWTADDSVKDDFTIVLLRGPSQQNGPFFYVSSEDAADYALDDFIALDQQTHQQSTKFVYKDGTTIDATVAGEAARTFTYTYKSKTASNGQTYNGQIWELIHDGARYSLAVGPIGSAVLEINDILSSFTFTDANGTNGNSQLATWTDPNSYVSFQYPSTWTTDTVDDPDVALFLKSPEGMYFFVYLYDPQSDTIDKEIQNLREGRSQNKTYSFTFGAVQDLKIGGEPAKLSPWTFAKKDDKTVKGSGADYAVNHSNREFLFEAFNSAANKSDLDALIGTVSFTGTTNNNNTGGKTTTWQDQSGTVQLQYPTGWTAGVDTSYDGNVVTLQSPNGEVFYIDLYNQFDSLDSVVSVIQSNHQKSDKYTYKDSAAQDAKVGGEPAKAIAYTYTAKGKTNATTYQAKIWVLNHGGKGYYISGSPIDQVSAQVEAIVASIKFLK